MTSELVRNEIAHLQKIANGTTDDLVKLAHRCFYWHNDLNNEWCIDIEPRRGEHKIGSLTLIMPETVVSIKNLLNRNDKRASIGVAMNLRDATYMALALWLNNCKTDSESDLSFSHVPDAYIYDGDQ